MLTLVAEILRVITTHFKNNLSHGNQFIADRPHPSAHRAPEYRYRSKPSFPFPNPLFRELYNMV